MNLREKWDAVYQKTPRDLRPGPSFVLKEYDFLLPAEGDAIDLACGMGGNALFLAQRGLRTRAVDASAAAIRHLSRIAGADRLDLVCEVMDLEQEPLPRESFDVVVVTRFLDRKLNQALAGALRPGGLLYFQTFTGDKDPSVGPKNPGFLLEENELLKTFSGLVLRAYCESGRVGDLSRGFRNEALLVAQKPVFK